MLQQASGEKVNTSHRYSTFLRQSFVNCLIVEMANKLQETAKIY